MVVRVPTHGGRAVAEENRDCEPDFEPPFLVIIDGKIVHEGIRNRWDAQYIVDHLRPEHPGSPDRVQAFDASGLDPDTRSGRVVLDWGMITRRSRGIAHASLVSTTYRRSRSGRADPTSL